MGRKCRYNKKTLEEAVNRYFRGILYRRPVTRSVPAGTDDKGRQLYEEQQIYDLDGCAVVVEDYAVPPTVGSLCQALGIDRDTWAHYCDRELHPEFIGTTTRARERMRAWNEEQLLTRKDVKGIVFNLENNYGYAGSKKEVTVTGTAALKTSQGELTLEEKEQLLRQIGKEFGADPDGDDGRED